MLARKAGTSATLHVLRKRPHRFLRNATPFATAKGSFGLINCGKDFRTGVLAFLSQGERFFHRILFAQNASAFDRLANKRLLIRGQMYFHPLSVEVMKAGVKHRRFSGTKKRIGERNVRCR